MESLIYTIIISKASYSYTPKIKHNHKQKY